MIELVYSFEVHSNEGACRKSGHLGLDHVQCTMLLLDVVKSMYEGTEGNLDLIMIYYINLVAGILQ